MRFLSRTAAVFAVFFLVAGAQGAGAEVPSEVWHSPESRQAGEKGGDLSIPMGVAANPSTGHIYVADSNNARVSEYTVWGAFVRAWGGGVQDGTDGAQVCTTACSKGIVGEGPGEFNIPAGVAVDGSGNVYVMDKRNRRVQKFAPNGDFIAMFGGGVDKGPVHPGNVCTVQFIEDGDVCGAGTTGDGPGEFSDKTEAIFGASIATGPDGKVYVGDGDRIQVFDEHGVFLTSIARPSEAVRALAVDSASNIYVASVGSDNVRKLDQSGALLATFPAAGPTAVAVDPSGNVLIATQDKSLTFREIVEFDPSGAPLISAGSGFVSSSGFGPDALDIAGLAVSPVTATGDVDIYVTQIRQFPRLGYLTAYGAGPDLEPPPLVAPGIVSQFSTEVESTRASLAAQINPRFWTDTRYYVEYGTDKCSAGGCLPVPVPPGELLTSSVVGSPRQSAPVTLSDLTPGTTYHYRFVAQSSGGGPVFGVGGQVGVEGAESSFVTPSPAGPPDTDCPNQPFRSGPSAWLPDCRAYELVSPVDKNGIDILPLIDGRSNLATLDQAARDGEKLTYSTSQGFGDSQGTPYISQYLSSRTPTGWVSHGLTPPQGISKAIIGARLDVEFRAFTPDLCTAAFLHTTYPPLVPAAPEDNFNVYKRSNCGQEGYELVTSVAPPSRPLGSNYLPEVQGLSADGRCTVLQINDILTPDANPRPPETGTEELGTNSQLYGSCGAGDLHLLSVLPNGRASATYATVGTASGLSGFRQVQLAGAVSEDGSRVYWTSDQVVEDPSAAGSAGRIFLRTNAAAPRGPVALGTGNLTEGSKTIAAISLSSGEFAVGQNVFGAGISSNTKVTSIGSGSISLSKAATASGVGVALSATTECQAEGSPCTLKVSETISDARARFWGAAKDGSRALFTIEEDSSAQNDNLYAFSLGSGGSTSTKLIARKVGAVMGTSEDALRAAFVSTEVLTGGPNIDGRSPASGAANLYYFDASKEGVDAFRFIGVLPQADADAVSNSVPTPLNVRPYKRLARLSPDGRHIVFMSTGSLTGYDNTDVRSGQPVSEIFSYDATANDGTGELSCVTCRRSGQRPTAREIEFEGRNSGVYAAGLIPLLNSGLYSSRAISEDGNRIFFDGYESLSPLDVNDEVDVYQWERSGTGGCNEQRPAFSAVNGGCIDLVSSGEEAAKAEFLDASPSGRDVFIRTDASLVAQDGGLLDIYDAREFGGLPSPPQPPAPCLGEACQQPGAAAAAPGALGSTNAKPGNPKYGCVKGRHRVKKKGKARCGKRGKQTRGKQRHGSKGAGK